MKNYIVKIIIDGVELDRFENKMTIEQVRCLEREPEFVVIEK